MQHAASVAYRQEIHLGNHSGVDRLVSGSLQGAGSEGEGSLSIWGDVPILRRMNK